MPLPSCAGPGQLKNLAPRWFCSWLGPRLFFSRVLSAACSSLAAAARLSLRAWIAAQDIFSHSISDWVILMLLLKGATGKEQQRLLLLRGLVSSRSPAKEPMQLNIMFDVFDSCSKQFELKPLPRWHGRSIARPGSGVPRPHGRSPPGCLPQGAYQQTAGCNTLRTCTYAQDRARSPKCKIA